MTRDGGEPAFRKFAKICITCTPHNLFQNRPLAGRLAMLAIYLPCTVICCCPRDKNSVNSELVHGCRAHVGYATFYIYAAFNTTGQTQWTVHGVPSLQQCKNVKTPSIPNKLKHSYSYLIVLET